MIFCKFCGDQNAKHYLYLVCEHLSCLTCAFLRAEFASQELQCCDQLTKIDQDAMETIIKSKRFKKNGQDSQQNKKEFQPSIQEQSKLVISPVIDQCKEKDQVIQVSDMSEKKQNSDVKKVVTEYRKQMMEEDQYELQNILVRHLEKSKKYFQVERQLLKQREEEVVKGLIGVFQEEKRKMERPITQSLLEKFNLALQKKSNGLRNPTTSTSKHVQIASKVQQNEEKAQRSPRESYDHILKKLQVNQQRMKQKIQRHLQVLY